MDAQHPFQKHTQFSIEVSAMSVSLGSLGLLANTVDLSNFAAEIRQYHAHPVSIYLIPFVLKRQLMTNLRPIKSGSGIVLGLFFPFCFFLICCSVRFPCILQHFGEKPKSKKQRAEKQRSIKAEKQKSKEAGKQK